MPTSISPSALAAGAALWCSLALAPAVRAEQVRFRFVPGADPNGNLVQVPNGPNGALGERIRGLGLNPEPYPYAVRANQLVTFRHPYTSCNVTVPMRLPEDTPRMEHRSDRVMFNYGSYVVEARFLPDGSVEVVYNSGFLRPLRID
jgi:hypothetical protein